MVLRLLHCHFPELPCIWYGIDVPHFWVLNVGMRYVCHYLNSLHFSITIQFQGVPSLATVSFFFWGGVIQYLSPRRLQNRRLVDEIGASNDLHPMGIPTITSKFHRSSSQQGSRPRFVSRRQKICEFLNGLSWGNKPHGLIEIQGLNLSSSDEFKVYITSPFFQTVHFCWVHFKTFQKKNFWNQTPMNMSS